MTRAPVPDYPWDLVEPFRRRAAQHPRGLIDLSVGSPVDPPPSLVTEALARATDLPGYPTTNGTPELRAAIAAWYAERRGVTGLAPNQVLPTVGSKEFVALLPFLLGLGPGDTVVHPRAAYPSYEMGALLVGATALGEDDPERWPATTRLVWLNSPGNPDGRVLGIDDLRLAVERARALGALIVGDECYAELAWEAPWAPGPTPCILDPRVVGDSVDAVLAIYSISKQSNAAGLRAAFVAGCATSIAEILRIRRHAGLMLPTPSQTVLTAVLSDQDHVAEQRLRYQARRQALRPALVSAGFRVDHSEAGLYLWVTRGEPAFETMAWLADRGILAGPGTFYGPHHPNHVRLSLTASDEQIQQAAENLTAS